MLAPRDGVKLAEGAVRSASLRMKRSAEASSPDEKKTKAGSRRKLAFGDAAPDARVAGLNVASPGAQEQSEWFGKAVAVFHARKFEQAKALFERAAAGPAPDMAHAARAYIRMCEQRLNRAEPRPATADEHYAYGVALLNQRQLDEAERHLAEAAHLAPNADHVYYALALCRGLQGDLEGAAAYLRRAVELQPQTRFLARRDPDFSGLAQQAPIKEIVWPEDR